MPLVYAAMAAIALMAVPVIAGPHGPETALGNQYIEDPMLGVGSAWIRSGFGAGCDGSWPWSRRRR